LSELRLGFGAKRRSRFNELSRELLVEQCNEQVLGIELRVAEPARKLLRGRHSLLRFQSQLVEVHLSSSFLSGPAAASRRARARAGTACALSESLRASGARGAGGARGPCAARPRAAARARRRPG